MPFDRVVLAGDIHNGPAALHWARSAFPDKPIVQIAGNHEYYGGSVSAEQAYNAAARTWAFLKQFTR